MEKAALSLAAAAVSPIITKLGNKAASYFGGDISHEELSQLQTNILPKIQTVIKQAERIDAPTLKPWLLELQADAYEAEDILDMYEYNIIKNQVSTLPTPLKKIKSKAKEFFAPVSLKTKLKRSFEKLKQSSDEADKLIQLLNLVNSTTTPIQEGNTMRRQQQRTTASGLTSPVFGRDEELNAIVNMLITDDESSSSKRNVTLHAIHGIGGAGKTTLAQYVHQDPRVKDHFDLKIWIHVSRTFDPYRITKQIIEAVEMGSSSPVGNLDVLQKKLKEVLKSKRFLLVLDDVWTEDKQLWDQLLVPLYEGGEVGSRILITTRMKRTVLISRVKDENILSLEDLKIEKCRSIFKYYAFDDADKVIEDPELLDIFEKILHKLKNSPLAARLVGSLLFGETIDAWRRILNSDLLGETMDVILLSFQQLPPHLQCCFAICSLYRKGYLYNSSDIDGLVRLWIAHGYVEANDNESLEDKGKQYFDDLLSYSLFQSYPTMKSQYVMHDVVHDLAETVSKSYCFRIEGDDPLNIPPTVIHLSIVDANNLDLQIAKILELVNLRTFIIFWSSSDMSSSDISKHLMTIFEKITKIRVLRFEWPPVLELNTSVGKLKHLRDLELIDTKKLPESLGTLYHLQFLCLDNSNIKQVPKSLANLMRLRCLILWPDNAYSKIENIGKLTSLQKLRVYYANKRYGLQQLKNLLQIRGSLTIEGLENVKDMKGSVVAMLNEKRHLDKLTLRWGNSNRGDDLDNDRDEHVLEGLKPNSNLKKLEICGYKGAKLASWIGMVNNQDWLPNLTSLELSFCPNLIGVSNLPGHLKKLTVKKCPKLMQLAPYPCRLEALEVEDCPGINALLSSATSSSEYFCLKSLKIGWVSIVDEEILNGLLTNDSFNSLSRLELRDLPSITSLHLGPQLTTLKELCIVGLEDLRSVKFMGSVTSLKELRVGKCPKLTTTTGAGGGRGITAGNHLLSSGGELTIDEPLMLPVLLQEQSLNSLVKLSIHDSSQDIPFSADQEDIFLRLTSLISISFRFCHNLPSLPMALESLSSLKRLVMWHCNKVGSLHDLPSSLESLAIYECSNIESLPNMPSSMKLLRIQYCHPQLEANYKEGGPLRNEISHIPDISIYK